MNAFMCLCVRVGLRGYVSEFDGMRAFKRKRKHNDTMPPFPHYSSIDDDDDVD